MMDHVTDQKMQEIIQFAKEHDGGQIIFAEYGDEFDHMFGCDDCFDKYEELEERELKKD